MKQKSSYKTRMAVMAIAALASLLSVGCASDPTTGKMSDTQAQNAPYRAVFHVADGDPKRWNQALNNARNVQKSLGKNGVIEIVANGGGIGMLKADSEVKDRIQQELKNGIKIVACENTMESWKLTKADMVPNIGYTPSGVVEVMQKQQEGWSYVRN